MLSIEALVALTDPKVKVTARRYKLSKIHDVIDTGWTRYEAYVYGGTKTAKSSLKFKEKSKDSPVFCVCSCTYFTMNCETVLAMHGNAAPVKAAGVLPMKRNAKMKPCLCPHLYSMALTLLNKWGLEEKAALEDESTSAEKTQSRVNSKLRVNK